MSDSIAAPEELYTASIWGPFRVWGDSDMPRERTRELELWRRPNGVTELVGRTRETATDAWSAWDSLGTGYDLAAAERVAEQLHVEPYFTR